jgi:serine/threonine-protein kinase
LPPYNDVVPGRERRPRGETAYVPVHPLAEGGMGSVELVLRIEGTFERLYARKRLHPHLRKDAAFRAMFMDEARIAGTVRHPNVAGVLDVGEDDEGPFIVMEYVDGQPLARLVAAAGERQEPLPVQLGVRIAIETARGLQAVHEAVSSEGAPLAIVHRDLSPKNVLLGYDGTVRVTDFGIAKALGNSTRTATGVLKGTQGYLAPEVLRFEEPDRRSDLFALGVILFELLAGRRLYANTEGFDGARRTLEEPPPDIGLERDVPPALAELLFELLAKDRDERPPSAADVVARLEPVLAELVAEEGALDLGEQVRARFADEQREQRARLAAARAALAAGARRPRRWRRAAAALALVGVAAALALALGVRALRTAPPASAAGRGPWAGGWHSCASDGDAFACWGKNNEGQIGSAPTLDTDNRRRVPGVRSVVSAGLGFFHTCACTAAGELWCFGRNVEGQLGTAHGAASTAAVRVTGLDGCTRVAAGPYHACALRRDRTVWCWGRNDDGQVAWPPSGPVTAPVRVPAIDDAVEIAAGGLTQGRTCAVRAAGGVVCWGGNEHGLIADGESRPRAGPTEIRGIADAVEVTIGGDSICARRRSGALACWGKNGGGQLGDGTRKPRTSPAPVALIDDAIQIATRRWTTCALRRSGEVHCWGTGMFDQLGIAGKRDADRPAPVPLLDRVASIALGEMHVCARHDLGIACWGWNENGQLGDGTRQNRAAPVSAVGFGR